MAIRTPVDIFVERDIPTCRVLITRAAGVPTDSDTLPRPSLDPHGDGRGVDADALVNGRLVVICWEGVVEAAVGIFVVARSE